MSALSQIAKDPSCLLAVDALQGGRWLSPLRPPVPRNFADGQMVWADFQTVQEAADWTHDYTFECTFTLTEQNKNVPIFYRKGEDCMFGIHQYNTGQVGFFTNLLMTAGSNNRYIVFLMTAADAETLWRGRHTIRIVVQGETVSYYLDDELKVSHHSRIRTSKSDQSLRAPLSQSGYVYGIHLVDDTTGETVWQAAYSDLYDTSKPWPSAPSGSGSGTWEERTGLLAFTNITAGGGVFRAENDAKVAGINTPLDFRGNTTSKTFIARAFCPAHDPASEKLYIHPFFGQGQISSGATAWSFQFSLWEECRSGNTSQLVPAISDGKNISGAHITGIDRYLNQWHTYAMVVDYRDGNCYFKVFVDGTMLNERGISRTPVWNTPAATTAHETTVGIRRDPNIFSIYAGSLTRVSAALIFDRALTAAEIAALSYAVV